MDSEGVDFSNPFITLFPSHNNLIFLILIIVLVVYHSHFDQQHLYNAVGNKLHQCHRKAKSSSAKSPVWKMWKVKILFKAFSKDIAWVQNCIDITILASPWDNHEYGHEDGHWVSHEVSQGISNGFWS